jgi:hypothetical protein
MPNEAGPRFFRLATKTAGWAGQKLTRFTLLPPTPKQLSYTIKVRDTARALSHRHIPLKQRHKSVRSADSRPEPLRDPHRAKLVKFGGCQGGPSAAAQATRTLRCCVRWLCPADRASRPDLKANGPESKWGRHCCQPHHRLCGLPVSCLSALASLGRFPASGCCLHPCDHWPTGLRPFGLRGVPVPSGGWLGSGGALPSAWRFRSWFQSLGLRIAIALLAHCLGLVTASLSALAALPFRVCTSCAVLPFQSLVPHCRSFAFLRFVRPTVTG